MDEAEKHYWDGYMAQINEKLDDIREMQSEQRSLRPAQALLRQLLNDTTSALLAALLERIGTSEALLASRFDRMEQRFDQTERSVEERLGPIEALLTARPA